MSEQTEKRILAQALFGKVPGLWPKLSCLWAMVPIALAVVCPTRATTATKSEILTFPLLVPLQSMHVVSSLPKSEAFRVTLTTDRTLLQANALVVPLNGEFKISFRTGESLKILDSDALDGLAVVQLPKGIYDSYLGTDEQTGQLTVEDALYYIKQEIRNHLQQDTTPSQHFYQIGIRPLPIPSTWSAQKYTLRFSNQGVRNFTWQWFQTSVQHVPFPPGIKEIGPDGGTIELPGVARLEIPAGALNRDTVVKMSQVLQASSQLAPACNPEVGNCQISWDFASPILKLEPFELHLNQAAKLSLTTLSKYSLAPASHLTFAGSTDITKGWSRSGDRWKEYFLLREGDFNDITHESPIKIKIFAYISKQMLRIPPPPISSQRQSG